jgi:nicotinate-nucleotide pyrophosphorylase (carboxylating)
MSGIASLTAKMVEQLAGTHAKLLDTRKTTPMLRCLEKYSVKVAGGYNHRFGLYDMIMLKENHIRAAGSISKAVAMVKKNNCTYKIEVEVTNLEELKEAVEAKVDRVMLDNMSLEKMKEAVELYHGKVELEASGNVRLETIREIAETGVDFISSGAITHSYKSLDISLLFREN